MKTGLTRGEDYDSTLFDFFIADGWASMYIRDLLGLDLNVRNSILTLVIVVVSVKIYKIIKKKLKSN